MLKTEKPNGAETIHSKLLVVINNPVDVKTLENMSVKRARGYYYSLATKIYTLVDNDLKLVWEK